MNRPDHPKHCPCGCGITGTDWLLAMLVVAVLLLTIVVFCKPHRETDISINAHQPVYTASFAVIDGKMVELNNAH